MAGLLDLYNSASWRLAFYPPTGNQIGQRGNENLGIGLNVNNSALVDSFDVTGLDVENPSYSSPGLAPPKAPAYTTRIGSNVIQVQSSQPYSPRFTYQDQLSTVEGQGSILASRASDFYR
jgi:hypothetical protein